MPLIKSKSKAAFSKNVKAEIAAGKPQKQAVAIAYSTKRAVKKAGGGSMDPQNFDSDVDYYEAREKNLQGVPSGMKKALKSIRGDIRAQQADYASKAGERDERARVGRAATKLADDAYQNKQKALIAERMKKEVQTKAKGGKVNSCW